MRIELEIYEKPKGQPRARYSSRSECFYTPSTANAFKNEIALKMAQKLGNQKIQGAVKIEMIFALERLKKPDGDNVEKAVLDALHPWFDDSQVVQCSWRKEKCKTSTIIVEWS